MLQRDPLHLRKVPEAGRWRDRVPMVTVPVAVATGRRL